MLKAAKSFLIEGSTLPRSKLLLLSRLFGLRLFWFVGFLSEKPRQQGPSTIRLHISPINRLIGNPRFADITRRNILYEVWARTFLYKISLRKVFISTISKSGRKEEVNKY